MRVTAYVHAKKGRETLEHAIKSATFPVDEYIVDAAGEQAFLVNSNGTRLLVITINDSGAAHVTRVTADHIAGARIIEGTRTIAAVHRGHLPVSYPSGDEVKRFLKEVSESAFNMLGGQLGEGDRRQNAESFYRLVAAMYLQRHKGIARPTEEEIQDMMPHMRAKSHPFTALRVELDVYQDGAHSSVATYAVGFSHASGWMSMADQADSPPIERARTWHRRMVRALEQSEYRASTPPEVALHGADLRSSTPFAASVAGPSPEVSAPVEAYEAEADSWGAHIDAVGDRVPSSVDVQRSASGSSAAPAFEGGEVRSEQKPRIEERSPQHADSSASQETDAYAAVAPVSQEIKAFAPPASAFEGGEVEEAMSPTKTEEDPYKALRERVRAPVSEVSRGERKEDDFESEWARQRAKVFGKNDGS